MARNPAKAPHPELPSAGPSGLTMRGFPGLTQPGLQHSERGPVPGGGRA